MEVRTLSFPAMEILCVGDDESIMDITQFFSLQGDRGGVYLNILLDRIIADGIYACDVGSRMKAKLDGADFNRKLKDASLSIDEGDYLEAMFCCYPDKMAEELQFSEGQKKSMLENSLWKDRDFPKR